MELIKGEYHDLVNHTGPGSAPRQYKTIMKNRGTRVKPKQIGPTELVAPANVATLDPPVEASPANGDIAGNTKVGKHPALTEMELRKRISASSDVPDPPTGPKPRGSVPKIPRTAKVIIGLGIFSTAIDAAEGAEGDNAFGWTGAAGAALGAAEGMVWKKEGEVLFTETVKVIGGAIPPNPTKNNQETQRTVRDINEEISGVVGERRGGAIPPEQEYPELGHEKPTSGTTNGFWEAIKRAQQ